MTSKAALAWDVPGRVGRLVGLPQIDARYIALAGILAGLTYTLSSTTVVFLLVLPLLFAWALRGAGPRERRWLTGVLSLAVLFRLAALAVFFLVADKFHRQFPVIPNIGDEYLILWRSTLLMHLAEGHRLAPMVYVNVFEVYGRTGLMDILAYWQLWFGPAPYGVHLLNVAMWLCGAVILHHTVRRAYGVLPAFIGFVLVLFTPTLFVWSISALKEPAYFLLTAATLVGAWRLMRARSWSERAGSLIVVIVALTCISSVRVSGWFVVVGGLVLAAVGWLATRRKWIAVTVIGLIVVGAIGAWRQPAIQKEVLRGLGLAATTHLGNVHTEGYAYRLLDPEFYVDRAPRPASRLTPAEAARFVGRAAVSFVAVPLPWNIQSKPALVLLPQQLAWYVLVILAVIGIAAGHRQEPVLTWIFLGNILAGAMVVALFNGNVGTLVRLRDTVVTIIVWPAALGGCTVVEWAARRWSQDSQHAPS